MSPARVIDIRGILHHVEWRFSERRSLSGGGLSSPSPEVPGRRSPKPPGPTATSWSKPRHCTSEPLVWSPIFSRRTSTSGTSITTLAGSPNRSHVMARRCGSIPFTPTRTFILPSRSRRWVSRGRPGRIGRRTDSSRRMASGWSWPRSFLTRPSIDCSLPGFASSASCGAYRTRNPGTTLRDRNRLCPPRAARRDGRSTPCLHPGDDASGRT